MTSYLRLAAVPFLLWDRDLPENRKDHVRASVAFNQQLMKTRATKIQGILLAFMLIWLPWKQFPGVEKSIKLRSLF